MEQIRSFNLALYLSNPKTFEITCFNWINIVFSLLSQAHNGLHHLVACKGSSVIVFSVTVKDDALIQKPSHKIIQGVHRMPITGLACTQNGTIFTCSLDGSVQRASVGNKIIMQYKLHIN